MCKKLCLAVGAVTVGLLLISFTSARSIMTVKWHEACNWMDRQVSPEMQLKTLHVEIDKIDKDVKQHVDKIAVLAVEVDRLDAQVVAMKEGQTKMREDIAAMTKLLESNSDKVSFNKHTYRASELSQKLDSTVNAYEIRKADLKNKEQQLSLKRQSLEAAQQRISDMRDQKEKLRVAAAKLETRIETVKVKQVACPIEVDDSQVNKCNTIIDKLDKRVAEDEKKLLLYPQFGITTEQEKASVVRESKSKEEVIKAAKEALQNDEEKVVEGKK
jgi:chromosome segregation ATPase